MEGASVTTVAPIEQIYISDRMKSIGLESFSHAELEKSVRKAFASNDAEYNSNPVMISNIGTRIVEEVELLARLMNPDSSFEPEWLNREEESPLSAVVSREEFREDYKHHLEEAYEVSSDVANEILEVIHEYLASYENPIGHYYS